MTIHLGGLYTYLMRIKFITDQIAVGGAINTPKTMQQVEKMGITHIINLDQICCGVDYIETLHYYIRDDGSKRPPRYIASCIAFALDVLNEPSNKLFIHCAAGRRRSTSIAYAVLRALGYSSEAAETLIIKEYFEPLESKGSFRRPTKAIQYKEEIEAYVSNFSYC